MNERASQQEGGRRSRSAGRETVAAVLILAIAAAALLHKSLLPGYTLLPLQIIQDIAPWDHLALGPRPNRLLIDPFFTFYPNRAFQAAALRAGQLPLWNPYLLTGTPVFADPNFQPFYPPNLLAALLLPVARALPWLAFLHLTLTGTFLYLFLRRQRLHWLAAVLGGGVWMMNGYLLVWLENPHRLSTAAWLPGIFWAYEVAVDPGEKRPLAWSALGGLFLGLAILGGQVQFVFLTGLMLALYALIKALYRLREGSFSWRPLLVLLPIALVGLGIGTLTLLPAAQFAALSHRGAGGAGVIDTAATTWPRQHLITLLAPDFFGNPATPVHYWGAVNYAEVTVYFGAVALLLALTAPLLARRSPFLTSALVLVGVTLALVLGTPLVGLLSTLPGSQFIALRRALFLIPLFGAWLAAAGFDGWLRGEAATRQRLLALLLALLVVGLVVLAVVPSLGESFAAQRGPALADLGRGALLLGVASVLLLAIPRRPLLFGGLLLLLALFDLWQWGWRFNPISPLDYLYPENAVTARLRVEAEPFRVLALQDEKPVFGPNILSLYQIESVGAYASLIIRDYYELIAGMEEQVTIGWMRGNPNMLVLSHPHPLIDLLNVKYVLAAAALPAEEDLRYLETLDGVWIYENLDAMPRAFLVSQALPLPPGPLVEALTAPGFDRRESAYLSAPLPPAEAEQLAAASGAPPGSATVAAYGLHAVDVAVSAEAPALLVMSDAYYPGWEATLDGEPVPLYRANGVMRAVFVPAGGHQVSFRFRPPLLHLAARLALAALLLALTLAAGEHYTLGRARRHHRLRGQ